MKKILFIYYTGTYNTKYLVEELAEKLKNDFEISITDVFKKEKIDYFDYDLLCISYPIYAFNAPLMLEKFLIEADIQGKNYFILKNSGEPLHLNDASSYKISKIMEKKGCTLKTEYHLLMPYNIIYHHHDNMVKQMIEYNEIYLQYIANNIISNSFTAPKFLFRYRFIASLGKLQRLGALVNGPLYKVDDKKCLKCLKCIEICPVNSITIKNGKITFSGNCQMCMRCSMFCPTNAINIGFLNNWKVNGNYNFQKIISDDKLDGNYLKNSSKRFYRYYHKYYDNLDILLNKKKHF